MFKDHEKFCAFIALLTALVWLSYMSNDQQQFVMVDGKPITISGNNPLRDAIVGIIGILGVAAQALFRVSETAAQMNDLLKSTVEKLGNSFPGKSQAKVPENVQDAANQVADAATAEANTITGDTDTNGTDSGSASSDPKP